MSNYLYPISKQPLVLPSQRYVIFLQVESDGVGPGGRYCELVLYSSASMR